MICTIINGCTWEEEFLDMKPNQSFVVPNTLGDYEKLLNNNTVFNLFRDPALGLVSSDEYTVTSDYYNTISENTYRNAYIWARDIYEGETYGENEWRNAYTQVYYANTVLEGIERLTINTSQQNDFNRVKGIALFFRSWAFYNLIQTYAMPYDPATSEKDLGIPLRLTANLNVRVTRHTVKECYDQILKDLKEALNLLPPDVTYKTQPSGLAALGFLSRIYLAIGDYDQALQYADKYLHRNSELTDYNSLSRTSYSIHTDFLGEDAFHTSLTTTRVTSRTRAIINPALIATYDDNDLRKTLLFTINSSGDHTFTGTYNHNGYAYSGIATDEIYLIRAECYARNGEAGAAIDDLNTLLSHRWSSDAEFKPYEAANAEDALVLVLNERRKELIFRGLRWTDLRRLNKEDRFKVTLTRTINGQTYTLPPNDPRYALPLPDSETVLNRLQQNPR
ncbi:RagB/SusD family nutrient uptake outer membrane protein [Sinomicrobium sp. M5D2P9]